MLDPLPHVFHVSLLGRKKHNHEWKGRLSVVTIRIQKIINLFLETSILMVWNWSRYVSPALIATFKFQNHACRYAYAIIQTFYFCSQNAYHIFVDFVCVFFIHWAFFGFCVNYCGCYAFQIILKILCNLLYCWNSFFVVISWLRHTIT